MPPFRATRYHLQHFEGVETRALGRYEKFNYIHAKLRNIVERRFGVLKERWHVLDGVPFYPRTKQAQIIIACFALENYLWVRTHGPGATYGLSDWVTMHTGTSTSSLREWVATAVWGAR